MRPTMIAMLVLACAGCVRQGPSPLQIKLASMVGQSETSVVRQWGVPNQTFTTAGHRFIAYVQLRHDLVPGGGPWGPPWWGWGGSQVITRSCEVTLEIKAGKVAGYSYRGGACD